MKRNMFNAANAFVKRPYFPSIELFDKSPLVHHKSRVFNQKKAIYGRGGKRLCCDDTFLSRVYAKTSMYIYVYMYM